MAITFPFNKKAIMGVSTLIIFITAILVAAVAASVIVRTVGILQERAVTVGTETRNRLVTALEYISITGYSNVTGEYTYGITMLVRTRAGSYAYSLATAGLLFTSDQGTFTAKLQHTSTEDFGYHITYVDNESTYDVPDMDNDRLTETVTLDMQSGNDQLEFYFSKDEEYAYADLGVDLDAGSANMTLNNTPIVGTSGSWYGFIHINGNISGANISEPNATLNITHYPTRNYCSFETLIPENAFCYDVQLGNTDTAVSKGEIYKIYYKLKSDSYLLADESFEVKFIPKKGAVTSEIGKMPDSITRQSGQIWPTTIET